MENQNTHLSISEISGFFWQIDQKIQQLHTCSSEDFLALNGAFKQFYKQSKELESNAKELFSLVSGRDGTVLFQQLKSFYLQLEADQILLSHFFRDSKKSMEDISQSIDDLFFPLKNLTQDLLTLKFLVANKQLNSLCNDEAKIGGLIAETESILTAVAEIRNICVNSAKLIGQFKLGYSNGVDVFDVQATAQLEAVDEILEYSHSAIVLFGEKYDGAKGMLASLSAKTEQTTNSIGDIVTKLQYQDIIRQKMEHIQASHKGFIRELDDEAGHNDEQIHLSIFSKIRDIAELQAAQLIHANKEYQSAIEVITGNFKSIGHNLGDIVQLCKVFTNGNVENEESHFLQLSNRLERASKVIHQSIQFSQKSIVYLQGIIKLTADFLDSIAKLPSQLESLKERLQNVYCLEGLQSNTEKQITELLQDLNSNRHIIVTSQYKTNQLLEALTNSISGSALLGKENGSLMKVADELRAVLVKLKEKSSKVENILSKNLQLGSTVKDSIASSVEACKYYDFFERVIVEIIGELNQISEMVASNRESPSSIGDNLKNIKRLYTMESEHSIHENVINKNMGNQENDSNTDTSQQSNIEFF
ncbi:MAG TPA: hypothetical protein VMV56_10640 [Williamwhitmania sp.]|nr:hypothetical protein [Williamwhitmania sp.]